MKIIFGSSIIGDKLFFRALWTVAINPDDVNFRRLNALAVITGPQLVSPITKRVGLG